MGQVVHAAKAGGLGRPGELIVAARRIDCGGTIVPLRGLRLIAKGAGNEGAAVVASTIPFAGFLVAGHNRVIPAGQQGRAIVAVTTPVAPGCGTMKEGE
ncbi:hypothetical protein [Sphingomonas sp. VNH70]|uniref:hypothetical protein n=1 Tax=Sphingomonas silueang TaxID=3156617 RepID=UPI0032B61268